MKTSLVLGFFDGVHRAHQAVINSATDYAVKNGCDEVVLVTLKNSPALFFDGHTEYILPREKSFEKIRSYGVTKVIALDFEKVVSMQAQEYVEFLYKEFSPISISTGFNHTFGANKSGNSDTLKKYQEKYGYKYICVPKAEENGEIISSSSIKTYLKAGNIKKANNFLGREFSIEGIVIKGRELGRKIGFPTANIKYPEVITKIPYGVYKVTTEINGKSYSGIMNWGVKPTISDIPEAIAEIHIINFNGNLYDLSLTVNIEFKLRDERKFSSLEELKKQIEKDREVCLKL